MSELDRLLDDLARGTAQPQALLSKLEGALAAEPERAFGVRSRLLDARKQALLSDQDLAALLQVIAQIIADTDATVLALDDDDATQPNVTSAETTEGTYKDTAHNTADSTNVDFIVDAAETTELNRASLLDDATELNPATEGDDATIVNASTVGRDDRTEVLSDGADSAGIRAGDAGATAQDPPTGASWPTTLQERSAGDGVMREFTQGDVLKDRFELVSKLGEGGMGAVWKAKDRLKEEARDRNPFVAVKLLQGDFKDHPEAFIALQREASKQQRLAHPNIATVYDFDRDGDTVYMTMEAMDGEPMDSFIRKLPAEGLPEEEAMVLIRDLCEGLAYAHKAGLVHSDLKPGNAFLVKDAERELGRIKLLDFGIARASSTKADAEGETTLFDPGQLGALTPTYATIEMFEGQDPDPRDDIYALAIMAYQLYTGRHPYGKKSAPKAQELGLEPSPIDKLDKRQNRGFARGLAFSRAARTPSVEEFLDDITRKKSRVPVYSAAAALVLLVIAALAWGPVTQEIKSREREEYVLRIINGDVKTMRTGLDATLTVADEEQRSLILADARVRERLVELISQGDEQSIRDGLQLIREPGFEALKDSFTNDARAAQLVGAFIARGDEQSIRTGLELIEPFDPNWQRIVKDQQAVKNAIIGVYTTLMYATIDPLQNNYGYAQAAAPLAVLERIYPDSAEVLQIRNELENHKNEQLARLIDRYKALLMAGKIMPDADADDIGDVLAIIARIDSAQPILADPQLALRFAELTKESIDAKDYARAKQILLAGSEYAADDAMLLRLRTEVETQLKRQADAQLVADISGRLVRQWQGLGELADFEAVRGDLGKLTELDPQNNLLAKIQVRLQTALGDELRRLQASGDWQRSELNFRTFARFLPVPFVTQTRARLALAERNADWQSTASASDRDALVAERTAALESLLADPTLTPRWALQVRGPLNDLIALLPVDDAGLQALRRRLANLYLAAAQQARQAERFDDARNLLASGSIMDPQLTELHNEGLAVTHDEQAAQARRQEELRVARIAALQTELLGKAAANQPQDARRLLAQLEKELPTDDEFIRQTAPHAIGEAYLRQASKLAAQSDFDAAASLIETALTVAPSHEPLLTAQREYLDRRRDLALAAQSDAAAQVLRAADTPTAQMRSDAGSAPVLARRSAGHTGAYAGPVAGPALQLASLLPAPRAYRPQVLPRYPALSDDFAEANAQRIVALAQHASLDLSALDQPLAGFAILYPARAPALTDSVVTQVENRLRELVQLTPLDVETLRVPLAAHARLFAERHAALTEEIVAAVERRIIAYTDTQPLDVGALAAPLTAYSALFAQRSEQFRAVLADRLESKIALLAQANATDPGKLEAPMHAYRGLYPQRHAEFADKVGRALAARLADSDVDTNAQLAALRIPLERFRILFPNAYPALSATLSEKAAAAIRTQIAKDIYTADKLRRSALKTLPGNTAIAAIRIELPLQEIIDANKLLSSGKLNAAMQKLQEATTVDAQHSDIPAFTKALQERMHGAQSDYDRYVRYTAERKDRTTRKKLYASATRSWSDNPEFVRVKEPRSGSCLASLAGHGRSKRSLCYDLVAKNRKGPLMVVVPAGAFKRAFAIGKYEITTDDFNRFCKATKSCKPGARADRRLPVTGVSLKQAKAYAGWLSKQASAMQSEAIVYRLPTRAEWIHAASANGEQPPQKSFNCRVTSAGNIIKGHALLSAGAGEENGWGLINHIGNARELATTDTGVLALGGAFEDPLTSCAVDKEQQHSGAPDALTGFRLLREIPG